MEKPKAYQVIMSNKTVIRIDVDEVAKVLTAMEMKEPCLVRQGLLNPSFCIAIIFDGERTYNYFSKCKEIEKENQMNTRMGRPLVEIPPFSLLENIFLDVPLQLQERN